LGLGECVADEAADEGQPEDTVKEENMEHTLMFSQGEEDEIQKNGSKFSARKLNRDNCSTGSCRSRRRKGGRRQHRVC
jgi:hypothetical protein